MQIAGLEEQVLKTQRQEQSLGCKVLKEASVVGAGYLRKKEMGDKRSRVKGNGWGIKLCNAW